MTLQGLLTLDKTLHTRAHLGCISLITRFERHGLDVYSLRSRTIINLLTHVPKLSPTIGLQVGGHLFFRSATDLLGPSSHEWAACHTGESLV